MSLSLDKIIGHTFVRTNRQRAMLAMHSPPYYSVFLFSLSQFTKSDDKVNCFDDFSKKNALLVLNGLRILLKLLTHRGSRGLVVKVLDSKFKGCEFKTVRFRSLGNFVYRTLPQSTQLQMSTNTDFTHYGFEHHRTSFVMG